MNKTLSDGAISVQVVETLPIQGALHSFWDAASFDPLVDPQLYALVIESRSASASPCVFVACSTEGTVRAALVGRVERSAVLLRLGYITLARLPVRQLVVLRGGWLGDTEPPVMDRLFDAVDTLLRERGLHRIVFERISIDGALATYVASRYGLDITTVSCQAQPHWIADLPSSPDEFLASRSSKHRYWLKRLPRVLDRDFPKRWSIKKCADAHSVEEYLNDLTTIAATTYHQAIGAGFMPTSEYIGRIRLDAVRGQLRGYILEIDGVPTAYWYCSLYKSVLHLHATGYTPAMRRYELGTVLLVELIGDQCKAGVSLIDFGLGDADYKQRFGSRSYLEAGFSIYRNSLRGACLLAAEKAVSGLDRQARALLLRVGGTQRIKTLWKRRLGRKVPSEKAQGAS
jgi:pimeloyl-ACP methyl ester carboxylesterase